jgi:hypothetical protein
MSPDEDKIRVTARISKELNTRIHRYYTNMAPAIIEGLELLVATKENIQSPNGTKESQEDTGELRARIGDNEKQIEFLKGQIGIKDQQLDKQAFSLQSVIQENSRLNLKLLPENTEKQGAKKSWYKIW